MPREDKIQNILSITPDDVIASILTFLPGEFDADIGRIHAKFAELKNTPKFANLLEDLTFINRHLYSYSPLLERIFARLQESKLLAARNSDFKAYVVTETAREAIRTRILPKFNQEQKQTIQEMAEQLEESLELN